MSERKETGKPQHNRDEKLQELLPASRERVNQGQQFDELQRQQKQT